MLPKTAGITFYRFEWDRNDPEQERLSLAYFQQGFVSPWTEFFTHIPTPMNGMIPFVYFFEHDDHIDVEYERWVVDG